MLWLVSGEFYHKPIRVLSVSDVYFGSCWLHTLRPYSTAWIDLEPIWCMLFSNIQIWLSHSMWRVLVIRCLHIRSSVLSQRSPSKNECSSALSLSSVWRHLLLTDLEGLRLMQTFWQRRFDRFTASSALNYFYTMALLVSGWWAFIN